MMGLSMGGMAVVARHVGERDQRGADYAVMQSLLLVFLFTIPLMAIGRGVGRPFLQWMGASDELLESSLIYFSTLFLGLFFTEALPTMSAVIRGAGHPEYTLRINILSTTTMLILDPLLVLGSGEIVRRLSGLVGPFADPFVALTARRCRPWGQGGRYHGHRQRGRGGTGPDRDLDQRQSGGVLPAERAAARLSHDGPHPESGAAHGGPAAVAQPGRRPPDRLVTGLGNEVLTGYSVVTRLSLVMQGTISGVGMATATMVGQNLGGKRVDRAVRSTWLGLQGSALCSLIIYGLASLTPVWLITRFSHDPGAVAVGVEGLRYFVAAGLFLGWSTTLGSALGGEIGRASCRERVCQYV
jgi:Na+-driven multidrug efflux pump